MSIFASLIGIFQPAADLIDELHVSDEERMKLQNQLAQIKADVSLKVLDVQKAALEAQTKVAQAEQEHGNMLTRSWRPIASMVMIALLFSMGFGIIETNELMMQIAGAFLGIYGLGRSYEKRK